MSLVLQNRLQNLAQQNLQRLLSPAEGIDFSSNDYLGFAEEKKIPENLRIRLSGFPVGASGSRLLRGNLALYEETENLLAEFVGREASLFFPSGYQANLALLSSLLRPDDTVFSDGLNHASLIDGIRLSKAQKIIYPHRDYIFLEEQLKKCSQNIGLKVIVTESLFSMEGTLADLKKLAALAQEYNALLIVDEAHSTGLWGPSLVTTLGLSDHVFASIHTAGKALGCSGAWIAGSSLLKKYLINFARPFIFSTAPSPVLAILIQEALRFYQGEGLMRSKVVLARAQKFRDLLSLQTKGDAVIIAIPVGDNLKALQVSNFLQQNSWDVRAIRPPTVPEGSARLRVTIKWKNTDDQFSNFIADIHRAFTEFQP